MSDPEDGKGGGAPSGERQIKVTDRRMFTADGRLREEYRHLEEHGSGKERPSAPPAAEPEAPPPRRPVEHEAAGAGGATAAEYPSPGAFGGARFTDLVAMVAEPAALYLGDVRMASGESMQDLSMARLHIDLLAVLKEKTSGNLTFEESAFLDDVLARLRLSYVQKQG